jgi:hypothetical protein
MLHGHFDQRRLQKDNWQDSKVTERKTGDVPAVMPSVLEVVSGSCFKVVLLLKKENVYKRVSCI